MDELRHYKERVKNQMNGFLIMYEVKKEETYKELSKKLQQSSKYQSERVFWQSYWNISIILTLK